MGLDKCSEGLYWEYLYLLIYIMVLAVQPVCSKAQTQYSVSKPQVISYYTVTYFAYLLIIQ